MPLSFDYSNKFINVPQVDASPLLIQTLVNSIREEEASERGIVYDQILDATGKEDLGGGATTGITAALRSSWKLKFETGAYQAIVDAGNLADGLNRVHNTGSPQVVMRSSVATSIATAGGTVAPTQQQIHDAVWQSAVPVSLNSGSWGAWVKKLLSVAKFLALK